MKQSAICIGLLHCALSLGIGSWAGGIARADVVRSPYGFAVDWVVTGQPIDAERIAACSGGSRVFVLNTDKSLYVSTSRGADGSWQYVTTPGSADSIACDGTTLFALNSDKSLWREDTSTSGQWLGWYFVSNANQASTLGGGQGVLTALNVDQTVWTSVADSGSSYPGSYWTERDTAGAAARIAGSFLNANQSRFFALNTDGSLWVNTSLIIAAPGNWVPFPSGLPADVVPIEIASDSVNWLYVLDSSKHLWTAQIKGLAYPSTQPAASDCSWVGNAPACDGTCASGYTDYQDSDVPLSAYPGNFGDVCSWGTKAYCCAPIARIGDPCQACNDGSCHCGTISNLCEYHGGTNTDLSCDIEP